MYRASLHLDLDLELLMIGKKSILPNFCTLREAQERAARSGTLISLHAIGVRHPGLRVGAAVGFDDDDYDDAAALRNHVSRVCPKARPLP